MEQEEVAKRLAPVPEKLPAPFFISGSKVQIVLFHYPYRSVAEGQVGVPKMKFMLGLVCRLISHSLGDSKFGDFLSRYTNFWKARG
jgi:hypothetical protein